MVCNNGAMFGGFNLVDENRKIDRVEFCVDENSRYTASNNMNVIVVDTSLGRVYINKDSYFANVPKLVWTSSFKDDFSPEQLLKSKVGERITENVIEEFRRLLSELIDAEYNVNNG